MHNNERNNLGHRVCIRERTCILQGYLGQKIRDFLAVLTFNILGKQESAKT